MLRNLVVIFMAAVVPGLASAETLVVDIGHDGHADKVIVSEQGQAGTLAIYEGVKLLGRFDNLIVDQPALSSDVVPLAGGGLAVEIDSDGSRNKFHMIVPVIKVNGRLYVDCIYKSVYDSVDETRSVGTSCEKRDLSKFDVSAAINDNGMIQYGENHAWLKEISTAICPNAVGLEYGNHRVARCAADGVSDIRKQKIMTFDKQGKPLFSVIGYELIPGADGNHFLLTSNLQTQTVAFGSEFNCFAQNSSPANDISGNAKLADKFGISYTLGGAGSCLVGHYSYKGKSGEILLIGSRQAGLTYLLELGTNNSPSTGLFVLDRLDSGAHGTWIGVPPKTSLTVN